MARDDYKPPRVGVNDEDAFVGAPPRRPTGPTPFDPTSDGDVEGEVALEVLPQMARATGSYTMAPPKKSRLMAAVVVGALVASIIVYVLFRP